MLDVSSMAEERRRWTRIRVPCIAHLLTSERDSRAPAMRPIDQRMQIETTDLSAGGICFEAPEPLMAGLRLRLELRLPSQADAPPMCFDGEVSWTMPRESAGYAHGIKFLARQDDDHRRLVEFLDLIDVSRLLLKMADLDASDLHLTNGKPPAFRVNGSLRVAGEPVLTPEMLKCMIYGIMSPEQRAAFESDLDLDFGYSLPGKHRWRVNVHQQRGCVEAAFRRINLAPQSMDALGLPEEVKRLAALEQGLVIVAGPTGSGKSTTLASLVETINAGRDGVIVTVEDPIEYVMEPKRCFVKQREVGHDTRSFGQALKHVLRQDPDVILIGEIRDEETMRTALRAAETGHLVLATLPTSDAAMTVHRVADFFPFQQRDAVLSLLSGVLQAVICQELLPRVDGRGKALATEVLLATPAVRALIREGKLEQLPNAIKTGRRAGMRTFEDSRQELAQRGHIARSSGQPGTAHPHAVK